jgi:holo-ACP synthase
MTNSILEAREIRWAKKLRLVQEFAEKEPVASLAALTLRMPMPLRASARAADIALRLFSIFEETVQDADMTILYKEIKISADGPESYLICDSGAEMLKRLAIRFESEHKWGELVDIDIMDSCGHTKHRSDLGYEPRKCFICNEVAAVCAAGRSHSLQEIQAQIEKILERAPERLSLQDSHMHMYRAYPETYKNSEGKHASVHG